MRISLIIAICFILTLLTGCVYKGLSTSNVESVVQARLAKYRLGGSVSVKGIHEVPEQNAAVADLSFNQFEYAATYQGVLVEASKYQSPKPINPGEIPSMEGMFPARKASYSGQGKAYLKKYNDGRWILEEVSWGGFSLTGSTELGSSGSSSAETGDNPSSGAPIVLLLVLGGIAALVYYLNKRNASLKSASRSQTSGDEDKHADNFRQATQRMAEDKSERKHTEKPKE